MDAAGAPIAGICSQAKKPEQNLKIKNFPTKTNNLKRINMLHAG
jgi:hypothetical protein